MADSNINTQAVLSVCATIGERVKELSIKNGQLIFIHDKHRIAFDLNGKRTFYNQIEELDTEEARTSLLAPVSGMYYFVIETAVLWTYNNGWIQLTSRPEEIVFIGTELPELGKANSLYVNKDGLEISIWDEELHKYIVVSNYTDETTDDDIDSLFN